MPRTKPNHVGPDKDLPALYKRDAGYLALKRAASDLGVAVQDTRVDANAVIHTALAYDGQLLKVEVSPHGWVNVESAQVMIETDVTTTSNAADGKSIAEAVKTQATVATEQREKGDNIP